MVTRVCHIVGYVFLCVCREMSGESGCLAFFVDHESLVKQLSNVWKSGWCFSDGMCFLVLFVFFQKKELSSKQSCPNQSFQLKAFPNYYSMSPTGFNLFCQQSLSEAVFSLSSTAYWLSSSTTYLGRDTFLNMKSWVKLSSLCQNAAIKTWQTQSGDYKFTGALLFF